MVLGVLQTVCGDKMAFVKGRGDSRPVFLDLLKIHLPVTALVSILHRVTGVVNILALPVLLFFLYVVAVDASYASLIAGLPGWVLHVVEIGIVVSYMYHVLAGVRHIVHDFTASHSLVSTVRSAKIVLVVLMLWWVCVLARVIVF